MVAGEMFIAGRRPSTPGANQQILFNQSGVEGSSANLTFDYGNSNLSILGNVVVSGNISVNGTILLGGRDLANQVNQAIAQAQAANTIAVLGYTTSILAVNTANAAFNEANLAFVTAYLANLEAVSALTLANTANTTANAAYAQANEANLVAQTAISYALLANTEATAAYVRAANAPNVALSNIASGNTSNIAVTYEANGQLQIDTRLTTGGGGSGNYEVDVYQNGVAVLSNANLNFNNTASVNALVTANGTTQVNVAFAINAAAVNAYQVDVFANGTVVLDDSSINFNNTSMVNVYASANGTTQSNIALNVNAAAVLAGVISGNTSNIAITYNANGNVSIDTRVVESGAYEVDVYANGTSVLANANLNFNNTATTNVSITANGTTQVNVALNVNIAAVVANTEANVSNAYAQANQANLVAQTALSYVYLANQEAVAAWVLANSAVQNVVSGNTSNVIVTRSGANVTIDTRLTGTGGGGNGLAVTSISSENFTATANQTVFTLNVTPQTPNYIIVNVNGSVQDPNIHYTLNVNVVTFTSNLHANDLVEFREFSNFAYSGSTPGVYANGGLVVNTANINFNNSATINANAVANGNQGNVEFDLNVLQTAINTMPIISSPLISYYGVT